MSWCSNTYDNEVWVEVRDMIKFFSRIFVHKFIRSSVSESQEQQSQCCLIKMMHSLYVAKCEVCCCLVIFCDIHIR